MLRPRFGMLVLMTALLAAISIGCETSDTAANSSTERAESSSSSTESESQLPAKQESAQMSEATAERAGDQGNDGSDEGTGEVEADEQNVELGIRAQAEPFEGIVTAGQPTEEQFARLDVAGVTHVINFRTDEEPGTWDEQARAEKLGLEYTHIPVGSPDDLNRERVEAFDQALDSSDGKTLVHCGSSNRVGAMFALRSFWIRGKGVNKALEVGRRAGMGSLAEAVRDKIK